MGEVSDSVYLVVGHSIKIRALCDHPVGHGANEREKGMRFGDGGMNSLKTAQCI